MPRPTGLEFGNWSGQWIVAGCICLLAGGLFALAGGGFLAVGGDDSLAERRIMGGGFLLIGTVAVLNGVWIIVKRRDLTIVLSDHAVHIGPYHDRRPIPFREITRVLRGMDADVWLERTGRVLLYRLPPYFASGDEVNRFIDELRKRVENAKRLTESPPVTS